MFKQISVLTALLGLSLGAHAADMANGARINKSCALCHGVYGQGAPGKLSPRIAGLPREYLIKATKDYRDGKRNYPLMVFTSGLKTMSDRDIEDVSAYLASLDLSSDARFDIKSVGGNAANGEQLYKDCHSCHARDGYGRPTKEAPPLAGQHPAYLFTMMKGFKDRSRVHDNDPGDDSFTDYSDQDLMDLTAYTSGFDDRRILAGYQFVPPMFPDVPRRPLPMRPPMPPMPGMPAPAVAQQEPQQESGILVTDIKQTVVRIPLSPNIKREDAIDAMLSKAVDLNQKLVGRQDVSKELEARGEKTPYLAIFQFCSPMDARTMIMADPIFSSYMPCRISMVEDQQGKTWLMMLNLDMIINSKLLPQEVVETAVKVNTQMLEIMAAGATGEF